MEYFIFAIVLFILLILFFVKGVFDEKRFYKRLLIKFRDEYGKAPKREYTRDELDGIAELFYRHNSEHSIDDITAGDIEINDIFKRFNYCKSSCGDSVLYDMLRNPGNETVKSSGFENKVRYFNDNEEERIKAQKFFHLIGRMNKVNFFDCIDYFDSVSSKNPASDYMAVLFILIGVALIFVKAALGILVVIAASVVNIIMYYSKRGVIEPYVLTFAYISNFISNGEKLADLNISCLEEENAKLREYVKLLRPFTKKAKYVSSGTKSVGSGNPLDILLDYGKMLLHVDIIEFYKMLDFLKENKQLIEEMYITLGEVDSLISIASLRSSLDFWCNPEEGSGIIIKDGYHPLIENPVTNSIDAKKGVLITGSNASGKSTFLKMILLNIICAETINTCFASKYEGENYSIFSSMSLRDDLSGSDSYFMVEIKAMKRIIDYCQANPDRKIVCFVDEVLRGTNTVERIASSTEILKYLASENCLPFAATHDGELTFLLEREYDNYHFDEEIKDDDVLFNYMLKEGRATSRNAIRLLGVMGFNESIIEGASERARLFIEKGEWMS